MSNEQAAKKAVGERAAAMVEAGMRLGLGTGSTAAYAIEALGRRVQEEGLEVVGTPTSFAAERLARQHHIPLATLDELDELDLAFDGADEVDPALNLIKGRGGAHTREKVVAWVARRFLVLADAFKVVEWLGMNHPVPIEVLPMATSPVSRALERLGADPTLRMAEKKDGPVVTDQGLWIIDARFDTIGDPAELDGRLNALPGVLGHGLFIGMATDVLVGTSGGEVEHRQR
ncbi:MAG: ribose-5-phosphate isomerase RpiA [Rhodothermales bacterium]